MPGNPDCTVYVGNVDGRVTDRVLYEILIQAGRVLDLYIPRDKETNCPKGYAFAEYDSKDSADYAIRLFSGLVSLYNRTLKFAISGQDKPSQNSASPMMPASNSPPKPRSQPLQLNNSQNSQQPPQFLTPCRFSAYPQSTSANYPQAPALGVIGNGCKSNCYSNSFDYGRNFRTSLDSIGCYEANSSRQMYDSRNPIPYTFY